MKLHITNSLIWSKRRRNQGGRFLEYAGVLALVLTLNFFLPRLLPGDPFSHLAAEADTVTMSYSQEQIEQYKAYYGLDRPLVQQYGVYWGQLLCGDLGYSLYYQEPVSAMLLKRSPWTLWLVTASLLASAFGGSILGSFSAWHRNAAWEGKLYVAMVALMEIPAFIIGILFLLIGAAWLGWFPLSGGKSPFLGTPSFGAWIVDVLYHAALPLATLIVSRLGGFYLLARNSMITVLSKEYMQTAEAKGLAFSRRLWAHALRNALIPVVTRLFLSFGQVLGGAILVENVFQYPGVGSLLRDAVMLRDYVLIQGVFLFVAVLMLGSNFFADAVCKRLDPRI